MESNENKSMLKPEVIEKIRALRLIDDEFLNACFHENIECTELLLRIILGEPDLKVESVRAQETLKNLHGRSLRLDIHSVTAKGHQNIEVQRASKGANPKRARYHAALLDANTVDPGEFFEKLPETHVIFITEADFWEEGLPLYVIEKSVKGTSKAFDDGMSIIYVNGAYRGNDDIGKLMHDFFCTDPKDMNFKPLADRARYFKTDEGGMRQMSEIMENWISEEKEKIVLNMLKIGKLSYEEIAEGVGVPLAKVQELAGKKTA